MEKLLALHSKCDVLLSDFKRKRRDAYLMCKDVSKHDECIDKVSYIMNKVQSEIQAAAEQEDVRIVNELIDDYVDYETDVHTELIDSIRRELENIDKEKWYDDNFGNWEKMPDRQDCDHYPLKDRLEYSKKRREMFDHLEHKYKTKIFGPNLAGRLEFF